MPQPSILQKADDSEVLIPNNTNQVQVVRDRSSWTSGQYFAYNELGEKEKIGGTGSSLPVEVDSPDGITLTSDVTGGVSPFTYSWTVRSKVINGNTISFTGAVNAAVATINQPAGPVFRFFNGLVAVKVTDAEGKIGYGYWKTRKVPAI